MNKRMKSSKIRADEKTNRADKRKNRTTIDKIGTMITMVIALLLTSTVTLVVATENIVPNPGFENGVNTPFNWNLISNNGNVPSWDSSYHSGSKSIKIGASRINAKSGYIKSDPIKVDPLTDYTFTSWIKTSGIRDTSPTIRVREFDTNMNLLRQDNLVFTKGSYNWRNKKLSIKTLADTNYIDIYADTTGRGTFWIDDVEVIPLLTIPTPPTPTSTPTPTPTSTPTPTPTTPTPTSTQTPTPMPPPQTDWNLVWNDEFDGGSIDTNKWDIFEGSADGNTCYMPNAVTVSDGQAHFAITRTNTTCIDYGNGNGEGKQVSHNYAGGGIGNYQGPRNGYVQSAGRWETRARFPLGKGTTAYIALWPANNIWTAEVDFAEAAGLYPREMTFTQHWNGNIADKSEEVSIDTDISQFHTYAVEMENGQLKWYVDDNLIATQVQHFGTTPMGFTAGSWAGNCANSWPGCPSNTPLPAYLDIDYMRIYSR